MKEGFRQCMAWLHTWTGLVVGWVLFFVFTTGTIGYFYTEVDRWMKPELPAPAAIAPIATQLQLAETFLKSRAGNAGEWSINFGGSELAAALFAARRHASGGHYRRPRSFPGDLAICVACRSGGRGRAADRRNFSASTASSLKSYLSITIVRS